ncbi:MULTISPECIES: helix-turn-helix transcriptional regulator [unclassified Desulfovibrio]|uniref:LexA family transcriptional regulator n=1 Tax=unclassified Desulfovibrio TaxID=2593640 RepID=UPI000F5DE8F5|nr:MULTISPECIES: helix-turn-helix transcriptional regulator [unclassified Desulfovibrio]RRD70535.1 helix-turn-helix transcriptional regulator [Desulfovibrio sp. OH1209_COT-279]RRD86984.1 helix-turn-helix transcriptional regulator [Desulfovibrio sp. OH1186_COT-070]
MRENSRFQDVLQRLMQALDVSTDAELARKLGITPQSVSGARKRAEVPPSWIQACAAQTGVNAHWLFFGRGPMHLPEAAEGELPSVQAECDCELITVPLAEARLSAGTGSLETSAAGDGGYAFRSDFLHRKGNPRRMVLMRVSGDSMVPEIFDNDLVLLDRGQTEISPGRLYAVGFEDAIYIKRIDKVPGKIILHSVNPAYPPLSLDLRGDSAEQFRVIGRVLWSGREYR